MGLLFQFSDGRLARSLATKYLLQYTGLCWVLVLVLLGMQKTLPIPNPKGHLGHSL